MKKAAAIKRLLLTMFVLLVLTGLVAILWPSGGGSIGHTVTFSDGATMTLKAVTYGTQHRYLGGGWQQRLLSLLPRKLADKFASQRGRLGMGRPSVAFWFERVGTGRDPQFVLFDSSGFGISGSPSVMRMGTGANWIDGWAFESWPRRERTFTLRIYEQGKRYPDATSTGEFTIRNPTPGKHPIWIAPDPPVTARDGDLSVTLFALSAGVGRGSDKWKPAPNPKVPMTRIGYRLERNGGQTGEWGIADVVASDATGNVSVGSWSSWSHEPGIEYVEFQPQLWPAESAWKLHVELSQKSNFMGSELWTLRGLPLSNSDPTNTVVSQTNLQGALLEFTGPERQPGPGGGNDYTVRVTPARPDYRLTLLRAVDDNGVEAKMIKSFVLSGDSGFRLRLNTNATSLDLTVALHQSRYFEFLVRPRIISTNEPAPR